LRWCNQETPKFVMKSLGLEVISGLEENISLGVQGLWRFAN